MLPWASYTSLPSKGSHWHHDWFIHFSNAHKCDLQTDTHRPTKPCYSVCNNRPHLDIAAMRPNNTCKWYTYCTIISCSDLSESDKSSSVSRAGYKLSLRDVHNSNVTGRTEVNHTKWLIKHQRSSTACNTQLHKLHTLISYVQWTLHHTVPINTMLALILYYQSHSISQIN